jgi:hypothetical protein
MGWLLRFITPKWVVAITIYPWIFSREVMSEETLNHERIHLTQQKELLIIPFFLLYLLEWIVRLPFDNPYKNISFERESYRNQSNLNYLNIRTSFLKYIIKRK